MKCHTQPSSITTYGTLPIRWYTSQSINLLRLISVFLILQLGCSEASALQNEIQRSSSEITFFQSGDIQLRGKLVTPQGAGPYPLLVLVHGSEQFSAVDNYSQPEFFAKHGFAVFVFDKRGTGQSEGQNTLVFEKLAQDVVAATLFARTLPGVDSHNVGLVAYSQGGWVAPIAAASCDKISFALINYGPVVSPASEDKWSTLSIMRSNGRSKEEIDEAAILITTVHRILQSGMQSGWEDLQDAIEIYSERSWFDEISTTESNTAAFLQFTQTQIQQMFESMDTDGTTALYFDPLIALRQIDIPVHWIFGGSDQSMPTHESVQNLQQLIDAGRQSFTYTIFPNADHGIVEYVMKDGVRTRQHAEGYRDTMIRWLKEQVQ